MDRRAPFAITLLLLTLFPVSAFADAIQGRVVKTGMASLDLTVFDPQGRPYPSGLHLLTDSKTKFSGVSSSSSLRIQDPVQAQVSRLKDGRWHADKVTKLSAQQASMPLAAPPSNALADALKSPTGQNVTRGAIGGAITGGVASYASGGKAGKGALVGAGVGAAAGLLQGLFSQPAQQQPSQTNVRYDDNNSSN
jgi:hypothetical protein